MSAVPIRTVHVVSSDERWALYVDGQLLHENDALRWGHRLAAELEDFTANGVAVIVRRRRMCERWLEDIDGADLPELLDDVQFAEVRP